MKPCSIDGCGRVVFARGWCSAHYTRWSRHGDPRGGQAETLEERFWQKVEIGDPHACWEWTAYRNADGYGMFRFEGDRYMGRAHVAVWRLVHGDTGGLCVLHSCDNPPCCNPAHLFLGTQADNVADMMGKGRHVKRGQKR